MFRADRLLAIRLDNIGDLVMLSPALRSLKRAFPDAHLTLMASPAGSQVAPLLPWIDEVMTIRAVWQDASNAMTLDPDREAALLEEVRRRDFDAALIFTSFSQSAYPPAYVCYLAGIGERIGQSKEFGGSVLSQWCKSLPDEVHQVDRNLHLLESAGIEIAGRELELRVPEAVQASADARLREMGIQDQEPFILLAPGASAAARRYDPLRLARAAGQLIDRSGLQGVVVGSAKERGLAAPITEAGKGKIHSLVGQTSVPELAAIIRRAALVVANDSGPMHMADAFRRPMVVLYSGTEYVSQWAPRNSPLRLLNCPVACSPCYRFTCPYNMECLDILPEQVVEAGCELLSDAVPA